ncbi:MAG: hypothetical protein MZW92_38325 [Comamonadaceae bacterium]|nr:hypothetical protein [Comamonadaceae bacterium]
MARAHGNRVRSRWRRSKRDLRLSVPGRDAAQRRRLRRAPSARRAVSSKATGRLEWLGVQEGQRGQGGRGHRAPGEPRRARRSASRPRRNVHGGARQHRAGARPNCATPSGAAARAGSAGGAEFVSAVALGHGARRATTRRARRSAAPQPQIARGARPAAARRRVAVDQTLIRAPFDGVVLTKSANVGDIVTPFSVGTGATGAVVTMADMCDARGRGRRLRVATCRRSRSASRRRSSSTPSRTCACAAAVSAHRADGRPQPRRRC